MSVKPLERRTAARGLLLTPDSRVLLLYSHLPWLGKLWMVPGGGMESGETLAQTAAREVLEETGLERAPIGPEIWWRRVRLEIGDRRMEMKEHFFLVPVDEFEPSTALLQPEERDVLLEHRWWHASEIAASKDLFAPPQLAALLTGLLSEGPPRRTQQIPKMVHINREYEVP